MTAPFVLSEKIHTIWYTTLVYDTKDFWIINVPDKEGSWTFLIHGWCQWVNLSKPMVLSCKIHKIVCITLLSIFKIKKYRFGIHKEHFLTLEDVPDSWDGDGEPQMVPMWSSWPYFSFGKGLGLIPSSSLCLIKFEVF